MKVTVIVLATILLISCNSKKQDKTELAVQTDSLDIKNIDTAITVKEVHSEVIYKIILADENNPINIKVIKKLNEPLKALAALYAALDGTNCYTEGYNSDGTNMMTCELTTALGLGNQGSEEHKNLIKKYLQNDKVAKDVIENNFRIAPSGASFFSEYSYLTIYDIGDTVKVVFKVTSYSSREDKAFSDKGTDTYTFRDNAFTNIKRTRE